MVDVSDKHTTGHRAALDNAERPSVNLGAPEDFLLLPTDMHRCVEKTVTERSPPPLESRVVFNHPWLLQPS